MKIDRLVAILLYLLSRDKVTARDLASYSGVTLRTIYRDMETLGLAGVPIVSYQGAEGGYGLVEGFRLDRSFFKEGEMLALLSALKGINAAIQDRSIEAVLLKLKALTSKSAAVTAKAEELPSIIYVPIPWGMPSDWSGRLEIVRDAIDRRRVVSFTYTKVDGRSARRRVEPLTVVLQAGIWYLYAWDIAKKDYRFFRLSRISEPDTEQTIFARKSGRRPYPWESGWGDPPLIDTRLKFRPEDSQKARDVFPWEQPETLPDGFVVMTLRLPYGDWVERQILSFGPGVEVIEPEWLREKIRDLAEHAAAQYRTQT
ncbi:MAG: YafY family transcriptional regulator [Vicinamibacteria bacterium]|nr:YafY family transcriptional regulator [Vicinamibacteria bacterium]